MANKQYSGTVTCKSLHGNTGEPISAKIELGEPAMEDGVWHAFKHYHPMATRKDFVIDPDNKIDPNLRSSKEVPVGDGTLPSVPETKNHPAHTEGARAETKRHVAKSKAKPAKK